MMQICTLASARQGLSCFLYVMNVNNAVTLLAAAPEAALPCLFLVHFYVSD